MDFNFKTQCEFDFHYFYCAIPEDAVDVDDIHTYRRDRQPFSSLCKNITDYEEKKRKSHEDKNPNPFTPVRESTSGQKRSRKYRNLDAGCCVPSTAASTCPTTTITTMAILSPSAPISLPATTPLACQAHLTPYPHPSHKCTGHHTKQGDSLPHTSIDVTANTL